MNAVLWNDVAGKRWTKWILRITQRCRHSKAREISLPERLGRHLFKTRELLPAANTFISDEEECPVADDRTSDCSSELIAAKRRLRAVFLPIEEISRVQLIVAQKLPDGAMQFIRPG